MKLFNVCIQKTKPALHRFCSWSRLYRPSKFLNLLLSSWVTWISFEPPAVLISLDFMFSIKPSPRQMNVRKPLSHSQRLLSELTLNHYAIFFRNYCQSVAIYLPLDFHFHKLFIRISGKDFIYCLAETQTHFDYLILFCQSYLVKKNSLEYHSYWINAIHTIQWARKAMQDFKEKIKNEKNLVNF